MARRLQAPTPARPSRLDLREALPSWFWTDGPGFEVWGGTIARHVAREHWSDFDRRWIYTVAANGSWSTARRCVPD